MSTDRDAERDRLAAALRDLDPIQPPDDLADYYAEADALLPVVDRIANEHAAAELEAAADEVKSWHRVYGYASGQLRARAAALREPTS